MIHPVLTYAATGQPCEDQSGLDHTIRQAVNGLVYNVTGSGRPKLRVEWIEVQPVPEWRGIETCPSDGRRAWFYWPSDGVRSGHTDHSYVSYYLKLKKMGLPHPTRWMPDTPPEPPR